MRFPFLHSLPCAFVFSNLLLLHLSFVFSYLVPLHRSSSQISSLFVGPSSSQISSILVDCSSSQISPTVRFLRSPLSSSFVFSDLLPSLSFVPLLVVRLSSTIFVDFPPSIIFAIRPSPHHPSLIFCLCRSSWSSVTSLSLSSVFQPDNPTQSIF